MTPGLFVLMLVVSITILTVLILKAKMHPLMALFFSALFLGVSVGNTLPGTLELMSEGFGSTLKGIGITIILGAILAMGIQDTGASTAIVNAFIRMLKGKNLELAPSMTGFVTSIPVFGDITLILMAPIASMLAKRKKLSMGLMASMTNMGQTLTHGLVPPTPGILAVAIMFSADLGLVIAYGVFISLVAFFGTWFLIRHWAAKEIIEPTEELAGHYHPADDTNDVQQLIIREDNLPSGFVASLPLLIPIALISMASFANASLSPDSYLFVVLVGMGNKITALLAGVICVALIAYKYKSQVLRNAQAVSGKPSASVSTVILSDWVERGLKVAMLPLLVTAMGGALSTIIKVHPAVTELGQMVVNLNIPMVLIPLLIAAVITTAVGSMTTAGLTTAGIVLPMMPYLGLSPIAAVLSIGCGTLLFSHVNNSGFWIVSQLFNLNVKQAFKYLTFPNALAGLIAFATLALLNALGLI